MRKHLITYLGSKKQGYRWKCSCGTTAQFNWEDRLDRTMEAAEHRIANREYPSWMSPKVQKRREAQYD